MAGPRHDKIIHQPEEAGKAQIGDDDHHAEQKGDGVEVDRAIGLLQRDDVQPHHQAGADQRRAGAVQLVAGQFADRDNEIGRDEDDDGGERRTVVPRHLPFENAKVDAPHDIGDWRDEYADENQRPLPTRARPS